MHATLFEKSFSPKKIFTFFMNKIFNHLFASHISNRCSIYLCKIPENSNPNRSEVDFEFQIFHVWNASNSTRIQCMEDLPQILYLSGINFIFYGLKWDRFYI